MAARATAGGDEAARPFSLYIHIPFCARKCPYCDFNTYAGLESLYDATVDALCAEMRGWSAAMAGRRVSTIFLGGGTPTVLDEAQLDRLFAAAHAAFDVADDAEITSEANPGTVDRAKFAALHRLGVNRLSLGVQSFQPAELEFLGRIHGVEDVERAVEAARSVGFANINLDLIFGLPHQQPERWAHTLERALALAPDHLSLYSLIVEENTPLFHWVETGRVDAPDDDLAADLYEMAMRRLAAAGFAHYEVSNWARLQTGEEPGALLPAQASRHNLVYWLGGDYLGFGPGAHSHLAGDGTSARATTGYASRRWGNRKPVAGYVKRMRAGQPVAEFVEELDARTSMGETMMLGLRLVRHGVDFDAFARRYGVALESVFAREFVELEAMGLLTRDSERVRLTPRGLMLGNQVFGRFVADASDDVAVANGRPIGSAATAHPL